MECIRRDVYVNCVVLASLRNELITSSTQSDLIHAWSLDTGECRDTLKGHTGHITCLCLTQSESKLWSTASDLTLRLWDLATSACLKTLRGLESPVHSLILVPHSPHTLISAADDHSLNIWDMDAGTSVRRFHFEAEIRPQLCLLASTLELIVVGRSSGVQVWDLDAARCLKRLQGHTDRTTCLLLHADANRLVATARYAIRVWDLCTSACVLLIADPHALALKCAVLVGERDELVTASLGGDLKVWSLSSGKPLRTLQLHKRACARLFVISSSETPPSNWNVLASKMSKQANECGLM